MTVKYIAIDGTYFDDKDTCEKYEKNLHMKEIFKVVNPTNSYESFVVKKDNNDILYIEYWDGNWREGGCAFNGTLKNYLRTLFRTH